MIPALTVILACQLAGEAAMRGAALPVPGPVAGMALLLALLVARDRVRGQDPAPGGGSLGATARGLLAHLSLMFVPAGVGVVQRLDVLAEHGAALLTALAVSTAAALLATAGTFALVARRLGLAREEGR